MYQLNFNNQRIIAISDTHGRHRELVIPPCDIIIHCGDVCTDGNEEQLKDFFVWYSSLPAKYRLFVSGNHDYPFVFEPQDAIHLVPENVILLENRLITIAGIKFYGLRSQENLFDIPDLVSSPLDFLITHIPPKGMLDDNIGCENLLKFVKLHQPNNHLFGHAHNSGNQTCTKENTCFVNASI
ncbi:MAG: metallophosphoesterase family protein [Paludibacter sp.]